MTTSPSMHWDCQGRWEEPLGQKASLLCAQGHLCIMGTFFLYEDSQALLGHSALRRHEDIHANNRLKCPHVHSQLHSAEAGLTPTTLLEADKQGAEVIT